MTKSQYTLYTGIAFKIHTAGTKAGSQFDSQYHSNSLDYKLLPIAVRSKGPHTHYSLNTLQGQIY